MIRTNIVKRRVKQVVVSMMALALVVTGVPVGVGNNSQRIGDRLAYADETEEADTIQDIVQDGETIYSIGSDMTIAPWNPNDVRNAMKETEWQGVYSFDISVPSEAESQGEWDHRFSIIQTDYDTCSSWNRILLGVPAATPVETDDTTNCLSSIRVALGEEARTVTVYFDSTTYAITLRDEEGNSVDYTISWVGNDDDEKYYTPEELSSLTLQEYCEGLLSEARKEDLKQLKVGNLPNFVMLEKALSDKLAGENVTTQTINVDEEENIKLIAESKYLNNDEVSYQWFKNNELIDDATEMEYIADVNDEMGSEYHCEMNDGEGTETVYYFLYKTAKSDIESDYDESKFFVVGNSTPEPWEPQAEENQMQETDIEDVYSLSFQMPEYDDENQWKSRICILGNNDDAPWSRILLGRPDILTGDRANMTNIRVMCEEPTNITVYFDSSTYGIVIRDEDGNDVDYTISWVGNDDDEKYYTPEKLSSLTLQEYCEGLSEDRKEDLQQLKVGNLPNFVMLEKALSDKLAGKKVTTQTINVNKEENIKLIAESKYLNNDEVSYQWFKNNELIDDATEMEYIADVNNDMGSEYHCEINDGEDTETAYYFVSRSVDRRIDLNYDSDVTVEYEKQAELKVEASSRIGNKLSYRWYKYVLNESNYIERVEIEDANDASYTLIGDVYAAGNYECEVTDGLLTKTAYFNVALDTGLSLTEYSYLSVKYGEETELKVDAISETGREISYQWYKGDSPREIIEGETGAVYTISGDKDTSEVYLCAVSDGIVTKYVHFYVKLDTGLKISYEPEVRAMYGDEIVLKVDAISETEREISYQWYNWYGSEIEGENESNYTFTAGTTTKSGYYKCVVSDGIVSKTVSINVKVAEEEIKDVQVTIHFENARDWNVVAIWAYQGITFNTNVTPIDKCFVVSQDEYGLDKQIWPGAAMESEEIANWYKINVSFDSFVENEGMALIFNNGVGESSASDFYTQEDIDAVLTSGIQNTSNATMEQTNNVVLNKKMIAQMGGVPTDLYVTYDGITAKITDEMPDSYKNGLEPDKYIDGVLYNASVTELIKCPEDKEGEITVPDTVTSIRENAFEGCSEITGITITGDTRFNIYCEDENCIDGTMFQDCKKLKYINISETNSEYKSINGVVYSKDGKKLILYPNANGESYSVPTGTISLSEGAFMYCDNLVNLELQEGITEISGEKTFAGCTNLKTIKIPASVEYICEDLFTDCKELTIYGMEDTYAETYAKENNIPFVALNKKESEDKKVSLYYEDSQIKVDISLNVTQLENNLISLADKLLNKNENPEEVQFTAFDINITDKENDNKVQPDGNVTVKIECPANYDGTKCKVYYISNSGKVTDMDAVYKDGYLFFNTNHFSTYVVTESELVEDIEEDSKGDEKEITLGDVNGDEIVDIKDSALIKRYLAGWEVDIDLTAADMDGDGNVTIKDSALLKRQLAGWED